MILDKPVIEFDLETTSANAGEARIVQFCFKKYEQGKDVIVKKSLVNPTVPIPLGATNIHGITDEMVKDAPTFKQLSKGMFEFLQGCILSGYNIIQYDMPVLHIEFKRVGIDFPIAEIPAIDGFLIFKRCFPHNLSNAYSFYTGNDPIDAHDAEADVNMSHAVIEAAIKEHELPTSATELVEWCNRPPKGFVDFDSKLKWDDANEVIFSFGRYNKQKLKDIVITDPKYISWIISSDFHIGTKNILRDALNGILPERVDDES